MTKTKKLPAILALTTGAAITGLNAPGVSAAQRAVSAAQAKAIVFKDAGVSEQDVSKLKVHEDSDNDVPVYDIEFEVKGTEYDYTVSAIDGTITVKEVDLSDAEEEQQKQAEATISAEEAKAIVFKDAGVTEVNVRSLKVHGDKDNDIPVYEIEFKVNGKEYDYTVNAVSGLITEKEID
ncbi:PepSY domain-containing protein [Streptococcus rifensis]